MSLTSHGSFLVRLTRLGLVNCYLLREDLPGEGPSLTLIDANLPGSAPVILRAAAELGLPIRRIVLTHAHGDHVGSLDALKEALPAVEVSISARDARLLAGDVSVDPGEGPAKLKGDIKALRTKPDRLLLPGDRVGSLRAVASSGHTPGHLAFFDERDGSLIAGDAFQTAGGLAVAGQLRPLFPLPALATWDPRQAASSAAALTELRPSRLAVGHGRVLEQPLRAMQAAVKVAQHNTGAA